MAGCRRDKEDFLSSRRWPDYLPSKLIDERRHPPAQPLSVFPGSGIRWYQNPFTLDDRSIKINPA
jgi:hypothetical protein